MKNKAPISAETPTGAESAQPKPNGSFNSIIGLSLCDLKEIHNDMPFVQS
jgi:hypothetical protein